MDIEMDEELEENEKITPENALAIETVRKIWSERLIDWYLPSLFLMKYIVKHAPDDDALKETYKKIINNLKMKTLVVMYLKEGNSAKFQECCRKWFENEYSEKAKRNLSTLNHSMCIDLLMSSKSNDEHYFIFKKLDRYLDEIWIYNSNY